MKTRLDWRIIARVLLAAIWLGDGLEKFGVDWPIWLRGGTGDVPGMLGMMADETPVGPLSWLINHLMLPLGHFLTLPVGLLEVALGLAFLTGLGLRWAGALGALIQTFFWLGFLTTDWPFQYPLLILAHLALAVPLWFAHRPWGSADRWLWLLAGLLAVMWVYEGFTVSPPALGAAVLLLVGLPVRGQWITWGKVAVLVGVALGIALTLAADLTERWGSFVWTYYTVIGVHLAVLAGRLLPAGIQRIRA